MRKRFCGDFVEVGPGVRGVVCFLLVQHEPDSLFEVVREALVDCGPLRLERVVNEPGPGAHVLDGRSAGVEVAGERVEAAVRRGVVVLVQQVRTEAHGPVVFRGQFVPFCEVIAAQILHDRELELDHETHVVARGAQVLVEVVVERVQPVREVYVVPADQRGAEGRPRVVDAQVARNLRRGDRGERPVSQQVLVVVERGAVQVHQEEPGRAPVAAHGPVEGREVRLAAGQVEARAREPFEPHRAEALVHDRRVEAQPDREQGCEADRLDMSQQRRSFHKL